MYGSKSGKKNLISLQQFWFNSYFLVNLHLGIPRLRERFKCSQLLPCRTQSRYSRPGRKKKKNVIANEQRREDARRRGGGLEKAVRESFKEE